MGVTGYEHPLRENVICVADAVPDEKKGGTEKKTDCLDSDYYVPVLVEDGPHLQMLTFYLPLKHQCFGRSSESQNSCFLGIPVEQVEKIRVTTWHNCFYMLLNLQLGSYPSSTFKIMEISRTKKEEMLVITNFQQ